MTRDDVSRIPGDRFTFRDDDATATIYVRAPADMTNDDEQRLQALYDAKPICIAIELEGNAYR